MKKINEHSAGFIVYRDSDASTHFLLLKNGKQWGFPKGHIERGETPLRAALRETKEEANLDMRKIIPEFKESAVYKMKWDFEKNQPLSSPKYKNVTYFLGESKTFAVTISEEHSDYRWVELNEGLSLLKFKGQKESLKTAYNMINSTLVERVDLIPGGLGDAMDTKDVDKKQLMMGIAVEGEHTSDPRIAKEIALDHLAEDPKYYTKLKAIENPEEVDEAHSRNMMDPFVIKAWALFATSIYERGLGKAKTDKELDTKYQVMQHKLPGKWKPYIDYFYEYKKEKMHTNENINEATNIMNLVGNLTFMVLWNSKTTSYQFIPKQSGTKFENKKEVYLILMRYVRSKTGLSAQPDYKSPAAGFIIKVNDWSLKEHMEKMLK